MVGAASKNKSRNPWIGIFTLLPCRNRCRFSESGFLFAGAPTIKNKIEQKIHNTKVASAKVAFDTVRIKERPQVNKGRILAVWILARKLPNSDLNVAVDFWVEIFPPVSPLSFLVLLEFLVFFFPLRGVHCFFSAFSLSFQGIVGAGRGE